MKHVIFIFAAIALLLFVGCGKTTQAQHQQDESMLVSTSESVPVQQTATLPEYTVRPTPEYTIRKGDTLWGIAERNLGSGRRYHEILALNPAVTDVTKIQVGTRIILPTM